MRNAAQIRLAYARSAASLSERRRDQLLRSLDRDSPPEARDRISEITDALHHAGIRHQSRTPKNDKKLCIFVDDAVYPVGGAGLINLHKLDDPNYALSPDAKAVFRVLAKNWPHNQDTLSRDLQPLQSVTVIYERVDDHKLDKMIVEVDPS